MVNLVFWAGIVVGWIVAGHFIRPLFNKFVTGDLNTLIKNNPMTFNKARMQLSPQDVMNARMQGIMI